MAKKKKEKVVEETTQETKVNEPKSKETKGDVTKVKAKMKMKPQVIEETITKVDLNKPPKTEEDADQKQEATEVVTDEQSETVQEVVEEVSSEQDTVQDEDTPVVEEITDEKIEEVADKVEEAIEVAQQTGTPLPEGIQKVVDFMEDTGGDLEDYVKLNQDYSKLDNQDLLFEYYKQTKPHLSIEEINFIMEDQFSYDEEVDEERSIKRKKLALKEQVASAKKHLDGLKSKYYDKIKSGSKLTQEQQEAINFYQKSMEEQERQNTLTQDFQQKTNIFFGDKFKGFEYNVGEKKFRINVSNASKVKETQSDIWNFWRKFLDGDSNNVQDAAGYHKSMYTAMNADSIANHFYEQGRADAVKESVTQAKNINMAPRQEFGDNLNQSGIKVRVLEDGGPDFKFRIKQK